MYSYKINLFNFLIFFILLFIPLYIKLFLFENRINLYYIRIYSKGVWAYKKPCLKNVHIKITYKGDATKVDYDIIKIKDIIEKGFCRKLSRGSFKLVIFKSVKQLHWAKPTEICFHVLLGFNNLRNSPFTYDYQRVVNNILWFLKRDFEWQSEGIINYDSSFNLVLNSLNPGERECLNNLAAFHKDFTVNYTSSCVRINRTAFDCDLITKNFKKNKIDKLI